MLKRLRGGNAPGRVGVIDAIRVDQKRTVLLVRRDNVEHLVMIGGPNDLVIEPNIMRQPVRKLTHRLAPEGREPQPHSTPTREPPSEPPPKNLQYNLEELTRRLEAELRRSRPLRGRSSPSTVKPKAPKFEGTHSNSKFDAEPEPEVEPKIETEMQSKPPDESAQSEHKGKVQEPESQAESDSK